MMATEKTFHWFVTSAFHWKVGKELAPTLTALKKVDGENAHGAWVWKVPGPTDASYAIEEYKPMVEGAEFITETAWKEPK